MTAIEDDLTRALAEHQQDFSSFSAVGCCCGDRSVRDDVTFTAHLAAILAAVLAPIVAAHVVRPARAQRPRHEVEPMTADSPDPDRLDALARAATSGDEWVTSTGWAGWTVVRAESPTSSTLVTQCESTADAEFIAATDPPTVLALTAELRQARALIDQVSALAAAPITADVETQDSGDFELVTRDVVLASDLTALLNRKDTRP